MTYKMKGSPMQRNFGIGSPLKQDKPDWSKAPDVHTGKRRSWYKKHNLKQDESTETEGYYNKKGKWTSEVPSHSSQIDMSHPRNKKGTSTAALWHSNLKGWENPGSAESPWTGDENKK